MVATIVCSSAQNEILKSFLEGKRLNAELREHYFQCVDCIAAVTAQLEKRMEADRSLTRDGVEDSADAAAAKAAIARGRAVLKREFGIVYGDEKVDPQGVASGST